MNSITQFFLRGVVCFILWGEIGHASNPSVGGDDSLETLEHLKANPFQTKTYIKLFDVDYEVSLVNAPNQAHSDEIPELFGTFQNSTDVLMYMLSSALTSLTTGDRKSITEQLATLTDLGISLTDFREVFMRGEEFLSTPPAYDDTGLMGAEKVMSLTTGKAGISHDLALSHSAQGAAPTAENGVKTIQLSVGEIFEMTALLGEQFQFDFATGAKAGKKGVMSVIIKPAAKDVELSAESVFRFPSFIAPSPNIGLYVFRTLVSRAGRDTSRESMHSLYM